MRIVGNCQMNAFGHTFRGAVRPKDALRYRFSHEHTLHSPKKRHDPRTALSTLSTPQFNRTPPMRDLAYSPCHNTTPGRNTRHYSMRFF
jgi:hypothetical protein